MKAHESRNLNVLAVNEWPLKQKRLKKLYEMNKPKSDQGAIENKEIELTALSKEDQRVINEINQQKKNG